MDKLGYGIAARGHFEAYEPSEYKQLGRKNWPLLGIPDRAAKQRRILGLVAAFAIALKQGLIHWTSPSHLMRLLL